MKKALWKAALFSVLVGANLYVAFLLVSTRTGASAAVEAKPGQEAVSASSQVPEPSAAPSPRELPEVKPRVEILPPTPSVYDSVPKESLTKHVAKVNGDPISVRLFERRVAKNRFAAFRHFGETHGVTAPGADFWTTSYGGEVPGEWLKQRALKDCVRIKVELGLAKETGLVPDTSYGAFLRALDRENERRRECLAKGEPIYGPKQYRENEFFLYVMNNMRTAVKRVLSERRLYASEATLEKYYQSVKDRCFNRGHRVKVWAIEILYSGRQGRDGDRLTRAEAKAKMEEAKKRLDGGERFEDVASKYNEDGSPHEYVFSHQSRSIDKSHRASKREEAMRLAEGEISDIHEEMSSFLILMCLEKTPEGYEPFESAKGYAKILRLNEKYEELVNDLVASAKVEVNQAELDGIEVK